MLQWGMPNLGQVSDFPSQVPGSVDPRLSPLLLRRPSHGGFISYSQACSLSPIPLRKLAFNCREHSSQERWVPIPALPPVLCGLAALSRARLRFLADLGWEGTVSLKTRSPPKKKSQLCLSPALLLGLGSESHQCRSTGSQPPPASSLLWDRAEVSVE